MQSRARVLSILPLAWGLAAQAAPAAPSLFPAGAPLADPPAFAQVTDPEGGVVIDEGVDTEEAAGARRADNGVYVLLGGGAEGYTGELGDTLRVGPAAGALVGVRGGVFGLELGYSASGVDVDLGPGGAGSGMDIVRNSGQAAVTLGLSSAPLQPYVLGGGGIDNYNIRNGEAQGFRDDVNFFVPVGGGLRYNMTELLTLDARASYNFLVGETFAPGDPSGQRIGGLLTFGGTY